MQTLTGATDGAFALFVPVLVIAPGPDFAVVVKSAPVGGRRDGLLTGAGVIAGNAVQGSAAALHVGAVIVASQALFETIRWVGVANLCWLARRRVRRSLDAATGVVLLGFAGKLAVDA